MARPIVNIYNPADPNLLKLKFNLTIGTLTLGASASPKYLQPIGLI
jgi:hypothetical protein